MGWSRVVWVWSPELLSPTAVPARMVPMSDPTTSSLDREARLEALVAQLRSAAEQAIRRMAAELIDRPDAELFGEVEYRLRDAAHELAAAAHQTGLEA